MPAGGGAVPGRSHTVAAIVWIEDRASRISRGQAAAVTSEGLQVSLPEPPSFARGDEVAVRLAFERGAPTVALTARVALADAAAGGVECGLVWNAPPERAQGARRLALASLLKPRMPFGRGSRRRPASRAVDSRSCMPAADFVPALPWALPFAGLLLAIAVLPLAAPHFWESNLRKLAVAGALALPVLLLYLRAHPQALAHTALEYASFMVLLGGLFVISGGIVLEGDLEATTRTNALLLGTGALVASFVGTTGASMLLIRPLLQTNRERKHVAHTVVFFIFLVSNIGGCLTPLGDPPLFLGYLNGVPFTWTFRLALPWLFTVALVLAAYVAWDRTRARPRSAERPPARPARAAAAADGGQGERGAARGRPRRRGLPPRSVARSA